MNRPEGRIQGRTAPRAKTRPFAVRFSTARKGFGAHAGTDNPASGRAPDASASQRPAIGCRTAVDRPILRIEAVFRDLVAWDIDLFGSNRDATGA